MLYRSSVIVLGLAAVYFLLAAVLSLIGIKNNETPLSDFLISVAAAAAFIAAAILLHRKKVVTTKK